MNGGLRAPLAQQPKTKKLPFQCNSSIQPIELCGAFYLNRQIIMCTIFFFCCKLDGLFIGLEIHVVLSQTFSGSCDCDVSCDKNIWIERCANCYRSHSNEVKYSVELVMENGESFSRQISTTSHASNEYKYFITTCPFYSIFRSICGLHIVVCISREINMHTCFYYY